MIGTSPAFVRARELAERVARFKLPVLITGETGTGKEVFSRHIHEVSERPGPLIPVNCASLQESLAESELFGHAKGAFTGAATDKPGFFQLAHGGTLFLDEVAELPMVVQAKLLRVIEDGMVWKVGGRTGDLVDVRIVSATHRPMAEYVARGKFRRDLYERLTGFELHLPPLRERGEDVILLAAYILANNETCQAVGPMSLDEGAQAALCAHTWPANIRELRRQLVRLAVEGVTLITADDLKLCCTFAGSSPLLPWFNAGTLLIYSSPNFHRGT